MLMFHCAAPYANKPEYVLAQQYANDIADLLAPQSGAYYDVWLDGEKFVSVYKEVRHLDLWDVMQGPLRVGHGVPMLVAD